MADVLRRTVKTGSEKLAESSRPARRAPRVSKSRGKTELTGGANIEGRISPRKVITEDSKGNRVQKEVDIKTANALLDIGAIVSLGNGFFLDADLALSADGVKVEDYKFGEGRIDRLGLGIGKKFDDGQIGIKGTYNPDRKDATVGIGGSFKFNKGGEVQMQKQMEMFQDGGLNDQGGSKDPVSGNDVPSGSLKEEVRDDIDAKLSPGEFVFPADVVRFIGLEKLMLMRDKAKRGLARMEEMGQMGNSDEATIDDDVPFGMEDLIIVAGSPDNEMSKGGVPSYSRGGQLLGLDGYVAPTTYYNPDTGQEMISTKIGGKFFPPLPTGFVEKPKKTETKPRDVKSETAKVESELGSGEVDGGPDRDTVGVSEMTETEQAAFGKDLAGPMGGVIGGVAKGFGMLGDFALGPSTLGKGMAFGLGALTDTQIDTSLGIAKGIDKDLATAKASYAKQQSYSPSELAAQREKDMQTVANRATKDYMDSVGANKEMRDDTVGVMGTIGGIPSALSVDVVDGVAVDPATGNVIGGKEGADAVAAARAERYGFDEDRASPGALGGKTGPDPDIDDDDETVDATEAPDPDTDDDGTGAGSATGAMNIGGLASKPKKKKQKKMKRGGLASR